jgi:hypothetical protein
MVRSVKIAFASVVVVGGLLLGPAESAMAAFRVDVLGSLMTGGQEIGPGGPGAGDANGFGGSIVVGLNTEPDTLCYILVAQEIAPAVAAHIHNAAAGANGPIVVHFMAPTNGFAADCVTEGELMPNGQPVFTNPAIGVDEIVANPQNFYTNVHNAEFPAGAIRGQLRTL